MITLNTYQHKPANTTFKGMPAKAPVKRIFNAADAIAQWEVLKHPKYTEIIQEEEVASMSDKLRAKAIREDNYRFLDYLTRVDEKRKFIEHFKKVTGFPILKECSQKMVEEFSRVLKVANENLNYLRPKETRSYHPDFASKVVISGYDEFCSVGLNSALPGSDIDKAYAIVRGVDGNFHSQRDFSNRVKGEIWNNVDNRIMSVNHTAAFPNIMTDTELDMSLKYFDRFAREFVTPENINFFRFLRLENGNPISASKFNIWLSERIPKTEDKYEAKNLAYVVEAIRDGKRIEINPMYDADIYNMMERSIFGHCSNIIQSKPMEYKYDYYDIKKPKLKARQEVERDFDSWSVNEQYELVKDIIRSMSGDNKNPDYNQLFHSNPDKHRLLINDILRGRVSCWFDRTPTSERTSLFFKDAEMAEKYADLNVYDTKY